jgi:hypothetical protein
VDGPRALNAEIAVTQIVGQDDDDVGARRGLVDPRNQRLDREGGRLRVSKNLSVDAIGIDRQRPC